MGNVDITLSRSPGPLQLPLDSMQLLAQLLPVVLRLTPVMFQDV